jgi:hypothetical protein
MLTRLWNERGRSEGAFTKGVRVAEGLTFVGHCLIRGDPKIRDQCAEPQCAPTAS